MRILKELDIQIFKERCTSKQDCFELLAELKWQDGYHCKRCESNMYIKGKQPASRRCSKCGYDESTTTGILSALGRRNTEIGHYGQTKSNFSEWPHNSIIRNLYQRKYTKTSKPIIFAFPMHQITI
jgi:hypothetical protein